MAASRIRLRYPATCATCATAMPKGTEALWNHAKKKARCVGCPETAIAVDRGVAGGSATREWQRRHEQREANVRARYGRLGGVVLALSDDPQSTVAWASGAGGERVLGAELDRLREEGMAVLHDRRILGSRGNIDHLVVSAAGVHVIDAKNYKGRVERRDRGGWLSTDDRLYVGGRDRTVLIESMAKQAVAVRTALGPELADVALTQTLCFIDADWSPFARPLRFGDVHALWPGALGKLVRAAGPLTPEMIARVERHLAFALPPA